MMTPQTISSASQNTFVLSGVVNPQTGAVSTTADTTIYLTITDRLGAVRLGAAAFSYSSGTQQWTLTTDASVFVRGNGPWLLSYALYDQNGAGSGQLLRTQEVTAQDEEQ